MHGVKQNSGVNIFFFITGFKWESSSAVCQSSMDLAVLWQKETCSSPALLDSALKVIKDWNFMLSTNVSWMLKIGRLSQQNAVEPRIYEYFF